MNEQAHIARAVAALGDRVVIELRLHEIEEALKWDEDPERRKAMRREYLDLWDQKEEEA